MSTITKEEDKTYSKERITVPAGWKLEYDSKWIGPKVNDYGKNPERPKFLRKGTFARKQTEFESVHEIELHSHYNGSGPDAFGGANHWPVVTAKIAFNEGEYELAAAFAKDLGEVINRWMNARGR